MAGRRPAHLARRGAVYFVRFRIPTDLTGKLGMVEFRRSLQTRDPNEARRLCTVATAWFRITVERLRRMSDPTRVDLENAARTHFAQLAADLDRPRDIPSDPVDYQHAEAYRNHLREERLTELTGQLAANQYDGNVELNARAISSILGLDYDQLDEQRRVQISQMAVRAEIAQGELYRHQLTAPLEPFKPTDLLFTSTSQPAAVPLQCPLPVIGSSRSLKSAAEEYVGRKRARGITESQTAEVERALGWLQEEAGPHAALDAVTKDMLRSFRTDLTRRDVRLRGRKRPFRHALTDEPAHQIKYQTSSRYWQSVQAFFAWSFSEGLRGDDPAAGLLMERPKTVEKQSPASFTTAELKELFTTPLFAGHKSPKRVTEPGPCLGRDGRWWFVVLAMHSGARAGELCQLLPTDFVFDDPVPHWKLQLEDGDNNKTKTLKTKTSIRDVPIHPRLLELGLREFVAGRAKRRPGGRILYEFRLGTQGRTSAGATRFFTDYFTKFGLHSPGRATHVFRHTVTDCLRENCVTDEDIGAFLGHSSGTQTGKYGSAQSLKRKRETILQLDYGFDVVPALGGAYDPKRHK